MRVLHRYFARNEMKLCYGQSVMMFADKLKFSQDSIFSHEEILLDDREQDKEEEYLIGNINEMKRSNSELFKKKDTTRFALHFHDYLNRSLQYAPLYRNQETLEINSGNFLFQILPLIMFNARKRVETQITRIQEFLKQMISSRRIDDQDSIRRNISQLMTEIRDNINKLTEKQKTHVKYGDKVMIVHIASGLFLKVEPRARDKLSMRSLEERFKPFKLTVTNNPDASSVFQLVPVYKDRRGHTVRQDQPLRLAYKHENPIERLFLLEGEYGDLDSLMLSEEPKGSMRLQIPLPRLKTQLASKVMSYHGAIVQIYNKEARRFLTLTLRTSQERIFAKFQEIKKKLMNVQYPESRNSSPEIIDLRTLSHKASSNMWKGILNEQEILTENLNKEGPNRYTLIFNNQHKGTIPGHLWQIILFDQEVKKDGSIQKVKVWLRHIIYNGVIGPLVMHVKEKEKRKDITVRFQTCEEEGRFINIDGQLSKKSEQFQFTKLVSLKPNPGKRSPTESLTLIKADQEHIRVAQFLSSVHKRIKDLNQESDNWANQIAEQAVKLVEELKDFLTNSRLDLLDKAVRMKKVSPLHQEILRQSHIIKPILSLYESMGIKNQAQILKAQFHQRPVLVRMLREIIGLIRYFIKNNPQNIKIAVIYYIPLLVLPNNFREYPVQVMSIIQSVLSHLTHDLFDTVQKSILLFLRNLLKLFDQNIAIYSQLTTSAKIELMITLKAYARILSHNHSEELIRTYFKMFVLRETSHPQIITNQFHFFYTKSALSNEDKEQTALIEHIIKIESPEFIQEQLFFYTQIYSAFLINKKPNRQRLTRLIQNIIEIAEDRGDQHLHIPVLSGLIRIMRHSFENFQPFLQYQPVLLRIEINFGQIQRQNQISTMSANINKDAEMETILGFNNFILFECLKMSVPHFIESAHQDHIKQIQMQDLAFYGMITKYHIEMMKMYNSVLQQPGLTFQITRTHLLKKVLNGYLDVCHKWIQTVGKSDENPYNQKLQFPQISPLELQILKMKIESQFSEMKENQREFRCLTQGVESIRNYLNRIEACYEDQSKIQKKQAMDEGSMLFMRRLLSSNVESDHRVSGKFFMIKSDEKKKFYSLQEEAWQQMIKFFNIVLDIDADTFLDQFVEKERRIENPDHCSHFVRHTLAKMFENPEMRFNFINRLDRIAAVIQTLFSWLPFIKDSSVLRKNLTLISRMTNIKQELRSLTMQSTFLSKSTLKVQSLQQIQYAEQHLLEIDQLVKNQISHWKSLFKMDYENDSGFELTRLSSRPEKKEDVIERMTTLLEYVNGFFSLFNPKLNHVRESKINEDQIDPQDLRIASKIFRVIKGHQVILNLIISMQDLLSQALQRYSTSKQIAMRTSQKALRLSIEMPKIYTLAFKIISKFAKNNAENKEIMISHLLSLLPTYGAMFQVALYCSKDGSLNRFHESFIQMYISIFHKNQYIVYASKPILTFMEKFNLRVVNQKFTISCKLYAQILQNSSDPVIFDLAFNHLKAIKRNRDDSIFQIKEKIGRRQSKIMPEELEWKEIQKSFQKMMANLQSQNFKVIRIKIEDFYYILRAQIIHGYREGEYSRVHDHADVYSPDALSLRGTHQLNEQENVTSMDFIEQQPLLTQLQLSYTATQSIEEKIAHQITLSPKLESIILREKEIIYSIIFKHYRKKKKKARCKRQSKESLRIPKAKQIQLKHFFETRNNRKEVLNAKLLYYISQLIKILEARHLFDITKVQDVRLQIWEIYFHYKHNPTVAKKLETRVVGLIAHFFINQDSISLQSLLPILLEFANYMLNNGSRTVQDRFYEFFTQTRNANIFSHINAMIRRQSYNISTKHTLLLKNAIFVKSREFQDLVLKDPANQSLFFLKSLCENHHARFQKFIRDQGSEDRNYDMIDLTVDFLYSHLVLIQQTYFSQKKDKLRIQIKNVNSSGKYTTSSLRHFTNESFRFGSRKSKKFVMDSQRNFKTIIPNLRLFVDNVLTALLAIIEYVQGPCLQNQRFLMLSTFMPCAEKLFRQFHFTFAEDLQKQKTNEIRNLDLLEMKSQVSYGITQQCALALRSIVEGRSSYDSLSKAIKTEITIRDIEFLIAYTYYAYCLLNNGVYVLDEQYFGKPGAINWYRLEAGFNFYFLMRSYLDEQHLTAKNYDDSAQIIAREEYKLRRKGFCAEVKEISREVCNCKKGGFVFWKRMTPLQLLSKRKFLSSYETYFKDALQFYKFNSAQIEVHYSNGKLETVYFPKAPSYNSISRAQKESLIFNLSADADSVKVDSIMRKGTELISEMDRRYHLRTMFLKIPVLGIFFARSDFWNLCAFWLSIVINFLIIFSYSEYPRRDEASLLVSLVGDRDPTPDDSITHQQQHLIGITQYIFVILGVFLLAFIIFGNLLLVFYSFTKHFQESRFMRLMGCQRCRKYKSGRNFQRFLFILWGLITDYLFIYTLLYLVFGFLGLFLHPYYFAFHISAIFRHSPELQNILKALWRPRKELFFTLIIFLMTEYIFALIIYQFYKDDVKNNHCISLATCILTVIDSTFKHDGGVGAYLDDGSSHLVFIHQSVDYPGGRVLFHQLYNFLIIMLIVQVLAAILIDTFGKMRHEKNKIEELVTSTCLICGRQRDQIERNGEDFNKHVKIRHNMFNYIMFIAYLRKKNPIDYTGAESYVFDSYVEHNLQWFPIYKNKPTQ